MVGVQFKRLFFDRPAVINAVDAATARVLREFGKRVRAESRASIKEASGPASAGSPPHSHMRARRRRINRWRKKKGKPRLRRGGFQGIRHILYSFDPTEKSVIIGPVGNRRSEVPQLLEYGGRVKVRRDGELRVEPYPARPFMGPAFARKTPDLDTLWRDSVRPRNA